MYTKENLVFSNVGDNSFFYNLWLSPYANYDVYINYQGDKEDSKIKWINSINGFSKQKGYLYNILNILYKNNNIDLTKYKYVAILDENITLERYEISICFELMNNYDLFCGTPSFTNNNYVDELFVHDKNSKLRFTNLVDKRVVFIRADILKKVFDNYNNELDDYGFEYLLTKNIHELKNKIAVLDTISTNFKNTPVEYTQEQKDKFFNYLLTGELTKIDMIIYSNLSKKNNNYPNNNDIQNNELILTKNNYKINEKDLENLNEITKNAVNKELKDIDENENENKPNLNINEQIQKVVKETIKETVKEIITEVNTQKSVKKTNNVSNVKKQTAGRKIIKGIGLVKKFYKSQSVKKSSKKLTKKQSIKKQSVKKQSVKNKVENKKFTPHRKVKLI